MTELVGSFRRPIFGGDGHVWLATRGPGEFVGECQSSSIDLENYTPMVLGQQRQRYGSQGAACACLRTIAGCKGIESLQYSRPVDSLLWDPAFCVYH